MAGVDLSLSGLASGFDWKSLVDQLAQAERTPQQRLLVEQNQLQQRNNAYGSIKTELSVLQSRVDALKTASLFDTRTAQSSDSSVGTAQAGDGTPPGTYNFSFLQLATAASQNGTANIGGVLSATNDVSTLALSDAGFANAITAGTFTVNGQQITIAATDTLQQVFENISLATGGTVTGSYNAATDKIMLASASPIILGSATDTSNFLISAKLSNNGTGTVASTSALGSVRVTATLANANFTTPISDGGGGAGEFKINGVSIAFNAATDTVSDVLKRINSSSAGVTASYDSTNDRFLLANKTTGDVGIALQDVTGNFLAAAGLSSGTLARGQDLIYTVNGGGQLTSHSNTITAESHGIAGLTVISTGSTTQATPTTVSITVASDTTQIKQAITDFLDAYNRVQSVIDTNTASSTDAKGVVTAGVLSADNDADEIARNLRSTAYSQVSGLSGVLNHLASLGITSSGDNNNLTLSDEDALSNALTNNLESVKQLFTDANSGVAVKLSAYLDRTIGDSGSLVTKQDGLSKQASDIDTQVAELEKVVQANRARMIEQFTAMETAQQKVNQQLQFLAQQKFGS